MISAAKPPLSPTCSTGSHEQSEPAHHLRASLVNIVATEPVQVPAPLRIAAHVRNASLTNLGGEHRAKPVPPEPGGLVADVDPALGQQILDVAQRQRLSHVHHHDQTDDLWRAVEISERIAHAPRLTQPG